MGEGVSLKSTEIKRGLVLGCGGVAGGAWEIATLAALQDQLDWDARSADYLIGTSVGSVLVALLGGNISVERMLASQKGESGNVVCHPNSECRWNHDDAARRVKSEKRLSSPRLALKGLQGKVSWMTAMSGLMPRGRMNMQPFVDLIKPVETRTGWVEHPATWIIAVDDCTGKRVALGREQPFIMPISKAVCASYAVPAWCPPVEHLGRTYFDGGIASPTSADFLKDTDVDEVIILAPMASSIYDKPKSKAEKIERMFRRYMTSILDKEIALLRAAGKSVIRLEPGPEDLMAFGSNMMSTRRRIGVLTTALKTAPEVVANALGQANEIYGLNSS